MHFSYVKLNILHRLLNTLFTPEHSLLWRSISLHLASHLTLPATWPCQPPYLTSHPPGPPPHPTSHPTSPVLVILRRLYDWGEGHLITYIPYLITYIPYPIFLVQLVPYLISYIPHLISYIPYLIYYVPYLIFYIPYLISYIPYLIFYLTYLISYIPYPIFYAMFTCDAATVDTNRQVLCHQDGIPLHSRIRCFSGISTQFCTWDVVGKLSSETSNSCWRLIQCPPCTHSVSLSYDTVSAERHFSTLFGQQGACWTSSSESTVSSWAVVFGTV